MFISVKNSIENAHEEYSSIERTALVQKWPSQSVLCVSKMFWTAEVHDVFIVQKPGQMRNYHKFLTVFSYFYKRLPDGTYYNIECHSRTSWIPL